MRPPTRLFGRGSDLARLAAPAGPWITLFGPAGVGKTELARAARSASLWIDVSELRSSGALRHQVARALEISSEASLEAALRARGPLSLVLDGAEGLDDEARAAISNWLAVAPELQLLVTAREPLGRPEERALPVGTLDPEAARGLFLARAERARGQPLVDGPALDQLLKQLDGLPLALELVAAWSDVLSTEDLLGRWSSLLPGLEAALAGSYALLGEGAQRVFRGAALFAEDFDLEGLERVVNQVATAELGTLVRKSLLAAEPAGERMRYRMLETVKAFALALPGAPAAEERHAHLALERGCHHSIGELVAAHRRWGDRDRILGARLVLAMDPALYDRGPFDLHLEWLDRGLAALPETEIELRAALFHARARNLRVRGRMTEAYAQLREAELRPGTLGPQIRRMLGVICRNRGHTQEAEVLLHEACQGGDPQTEIFALDDLGVVALDQGRWALAAERFEQARQRAAQRGEARHRAISESHLGLALHLAGDRVGARHKYGRALEAHRRLQDLRFEGWTLGFVAILELEVGDELSSARATEAALSLYQHIGDLRTRAFLLMPRLAIARGRREQASFDRDLEAARTGLDPLEDGPQLAALSRLEASSPPAPSSVEEHLMARLIEAVQSLRPLFVGPEGHWFEAEGAGRVSLLRRRPLQRLFRRLLRAHREAPGQGLGWAELLAAGWPGETVQPEAGARRVYVAIASLRKLGLHAWLQRNEQGYLLVGPVRPGSEI